MQRFVLTAILFVLVLFSACSGISEQIPTLKTSFSANVQVTMGEQKIVCELSHLPQGAANVRLTSPQTVQGVTYKWLDGKYSISYGDLVCKTDSIFLPKNSFVCSLTDILVQADKQESLSYVGIQNDMAMFKGVCDSGEFTVYVDTQSGLIQKISLPALDMEAVFSECQIIA